MPANAQQTDFDIAAATWDDDPVKVARAQAVAAGIRRQVPWRAGMTALELGCGTGLLSFMLQHDLEQITLADSSSGMLAVLGEKIAAAGVASMRPFKVDLEMDSLPDERFDLVYSLMTFHHVQDTDRLLHSLFSLLKPAGYRMNCSRCPPSGKSPQKGDRVRREVLLPTLRWPTRVRWRSRVSTV